MLKIEELTKKFDNKVLFNNFSYTFECNGCYALIGESGIGKTTLLRMISGLDKDYTGKISCDNGKFAFAFQEYRLFPELTALQNVVFAISNTNNEADCKNATKMLHKLGLTTDEMKLLPHELSGGMKQRVSLARAFLYDADILLLDEPTKELDAVNAKTVRHIISKLSKNKLVIIVSHNKEDITSLNATEILLK